MELAPGASIGHYDVTALLGDLGEGRMGQVWQATDTQLGCKVALKVLRPELTGLEAKVASALDYTPPSRTPGHRYWSAAVQRSDGLDPRRLVVGGTL